MKVSKISRKVVSCSTRSPLALVFGRALGFELDVEQLRTLPTVERVGLIRKGLRCFESQTCRRMGTGGLDGPCDSPGLRQTGDSLPLYIVSLAIFITSGNPSGSVHVPQAVFSRRSRQRCLTLWKRSGTLPLEYLRRVCGWSDSRREKMRCCARPPSCL